MNILLFGAGAREHVILAKLHESKLLSRLFLANPGDGFKRLGEIIEFIDYYDLGKKCVARKIDLVIIGPEKPLAEGIVDVLNSFGIKTIGANKHFSKLESSKIFAKQFMQKYNIPTSPFEIIESYQDIETKFIEFVDKYKEKKIVLKADGLCKGKGVFICDDIKFAKDKLKKLLDGEFDKASKKVIVEKYQEGEEISLICLFDGKILLPFLPSRDYKRAYDGNIGPNTGGMGAYCPLKLSNDVKKQISQYLIKLQNALINEKANFSGFIYSGLIITKEGLKVLEYNMRPGDPEIQALLTALKSDFLDILYKASEKRLDEVNLNWENNSSYCLVIASEGYPQNPKFGDEIVNLDKLKQKYPDVCVYYANVLKKDKKIYSNGGRVLSLCSHNAYILYKFAEELDFKNKFYRKDLFGLKSF